MSFATKKITDLTTLSVSTPSIEFVINDHGTDYKLLNSGIRITSSQISDYIGTHTSDEITDLVMTNYATSPIVGAGSHNLLSATHPDTVSQSVTTGDIMYGGASASWDALSIGGTNAALIVASGLPAWSTTLTSFFATGFTYAIDIITGRTVLSTPQVTTDQILVYDGSAAALVKTTLSVLTFTSNQISDYAGAATATYEIPIVMEVPNDTVCFPDIQSLATSADKMSGFILPDGAATASYNWKTAQAIPLNLASTSPVVRVFIQPLVSTASALAAFVVKSLAVSETESYNQALTAETTAIVSIPATTYIVEYFEQTLTGIPTAGDHLKGIILRDPTNASDNATSLMVTAMSLLVQRTI